MPPPQPGVATTPDETLVTLARRGDGPAREELFRRHWEVARRVAYRLLGSEPDAEDAVQEGLTKALINLDTFDGRSQFRTWLMRIVTNTARDAGRRRGRRAALRLDEATANGDEPAVTHDPSHNLRRADLRRLLDDALRRLNPDKRTAFVLFAEAGLSYKDIAEVQGVPIGTVMSRIHDARQKLQAALKNIEGMER